MPVLPPRLRDPKSRLDHLLALHGLLRDISRSVGPALELAPVLRAVLSGMRRLVDFRGGSIGLVDEGGVYIAASDPDISAEVAAARVPIGTGLAGRVVADGLPVYSRDLDADERVDQDLRRLGSNAPMRSYLAVPLVCLGEVIGVLQVDSTEPDGFSDEDLQVLEGLATQMAGAIESARRHEQMLGLERMKQDFVARVSHELRSPLSVISGYLRTLLAHPDLLNPGDAREFLEAIGEANDRLGYLVEELLAVASLDAGKGVSSPTDAVVADVLRQVRNQAITPDAVTVAAPRDLVIRTDAGLLRQVLGLLVDNALKFAGSCEVAAEGRADGGIRFTVSDRGPGVPSDLREEIFERFFRGDHAQPGMGLGLWLARALAGLLNAAVEVEDRPEGGAVFSVGVRPLGS